MVGYINSEKNTISIIQCCEIMQHCGFYQLGLNCDC